MRMANPGNCGTARGSGLYGPVGLINSYPRVQLCGKKFNELLANSFAIADCGQ
jgi:hypothetical protein